MSIPPVLAVPSGHAIGRFRRIGIRGLLALLTAAALLLISVLGALLPDTTLTLTWYVPVLDSAMVVMLAVLPFLSSPDGVIPPPRPVPPLAFASLPTRKI